MGSPTRYADADGLSIAYQVHGEGPLDLVFVPGFVSHVELLWEHPGVSRFLRRLASFSRLIVIDKRGQGLSDRPADPPTLEDSMDDLHAVMRAEACERPAIFGASEGGPMSALFAATYPERVSSLVLYGTYARMIEAPDFPSGVPPSALDRWAQTMRDEWGGPVGAKIWAPSAAGDAEFEDWWARLLRQGTSPAGAIALIDLYRDLDVRGVLSSIDVPALVLHRSGDKIVRISQARYLAESIPRPAWSSSRSSRSAAGAPASRSGP
jgi:pimeloyl-ACP methyl ester carboxylesterase